MNTIKTNQIRTTIIIIFFMFVLLLVFSCSESTVPIEQQPGRRDYEWSIDTIQIFSNYINGIWGSAPNDIWGVGPGGSLTETIWHYDGKEWSTDGLGRNISPECVYGFAKNDVWIAGANGKIWHYDGNEWSQNYQHTINGFIGIWLLDLYGNSNNDLYAVGTVWFDNETRRGIILHFDGAKWEQKYLADYNSQFLKVRVDKFRRRFVHCVKQDVANYDIDTTVFYEFDGNNLTEIFSDENISVKQGWMGVIDGGIVFSVNRGIFKYINDSLELIQKYDSQLYPGAVFGRNGKDIFISTITGIAHFNGNNTETLINTVGRWFIGGQILEKDVFFIIQNWGTVDTYIYHGKLKD